MPNQISITPIKDKVFGAVVTNVSLPTLNDADFTDIKTAFLQYGFLVFPGQHLNAEQNIIFGQRFGNLEFGAMPFTNQKNHKDGRADKIIHKTSQFMRLLIGNESWHTDSTYSPISSKCALLSAVTVTEEGGETELADMRAGYAALDQATRHRIEPLSAYHSTLYSQANDVEDFPPQDEESIYHGEAYLRPLVKTHPETCVKNLLIGRHAFGIPGINRQESRELLASLLNFVTAEQSRVYTHRWQVGDTLIWDNRALLHRARPYDYTKPRTLLGTRIAGDPASELACYPTDPQAQAGRKALASEMALLRQASNDASA